MSEATGTQISDGQVSNGLIEKELRKQDYVGFIDFSAHSGSRYCFRQN